MCTRNEFFDRNNSEGQRVNLRMRGKCYVWLLGTEYAPQIYMSTGFLRQEYWSGLPGPLLGIFPTQGLNVPWQVDSLPLSHRGSPRTPRGKATWEHRMKASGETNAASTLNLDFQPLELGEINCLSHQSGILLWQPKQTYALINGKQSTRDQDKWLKQLKNVCVCG